MSVLIVMSVELARDSRNLCSGWDNLYLGNVFNVKQDSKSEI